MHHLIGRLRRGLLKYGPTKNSLCVFFWVYTRVRGEKFEDTFLGAEIVPLMSLHFSSLYTFAASVLRFWVVSRRRVFIL